MRWCRRSALLDRAALEAGPALDWPVIIRPEAFARRAATSPGSTGPRRCAAYLRRTEAARFHLAPFVDYRSGDGHWRKFRLILVDGEPWPYHMAVHDDWTVWYYNARMELAPWKRPEEARFLGDFAGAFPAPARRALQRHRRRASASTTAASTAACCPTAGSCCSRSRPA